MSITFWVLYVGTGEAKSGGGKGSKGGEGEVMQNRVIEEKKEG
jgi:hypothetical protein